MVQQNSEQAQEVFKAFCQVLEDKDWNYNKDEENLVIHCGAQGDDFPIKLTINIDTERSLVILLSKLPFVIQEDKRIDAAIAICAINDILADGSFDYDVNDGKIIFRMANSFIDSKLGPDVFEYMLLCSCHIIDEHNDKLFALSKGMMSLEQYIDALNG